MKSKTRQVDDAIPDWSNTNRLVTELHGCDGGWDPFPDNFIVSQLLLIA